MAIQNVSTTDSLQLWTQKTNTISENIGDLATLTSTDKTSIVNSANELLGIYNASPSNVVEDLTPELGGNLSLNGKDITGTGNININGTYQGSLSSTTTATTPSQSDNSTKISTTAYTDAKIATLMASATLAGDVTGAPANLQIGANKVGVNELDVTENGGVEYLKTDGSGQLSFINTIGTTGGDLSGSISALEINANTVNVNELNVVDGTTGHLLTTSGSNALTFKPSVTQSQVVTTAGQTSFNISYIVNNIVVFLNGLKLIKGVDFTATNGTSVTLTSPVAVGNHVEFQRYGV